MQKAVTAKTAQSWEPWPDPDVQVAILPNSTFDLVKKVSMKDAPYGKGLCTIIVAPDIYQYDDQDTYCGPSGAAFVMTVMIGVFEKFVEDFADECKAIELPQRLRETNKAALHKE